MSVIATEGDLHIPHLDFDPSRERDKPVTLPCYAVGGVAHPQTDPGWERDSLSRWPVTL